MNRVPTAAAAPTDPVIDDGFGSRTRGVDPDTGDEVELLELAPTLVEHAGFVTALAERVARFATVRHASYAHIRRLDRPSADQLVLVSDYTRGWRVSDLLDGAVRADAPLDITVVIGLLRQLLPAAALYGRHDRESAIGALAPERLIVTAQARLVIAEHAFGPALEKLNLGRDKLWRDLRVTMPPSAGLPRANARADANALGVVALSLLMGRVLQLDEYPGQLQALLEATSERHDGKPVPLSPAFSGWVGRALQFDVKNAFQSPHEAQVAFEAVLASDRGYVTKPTALQEWVNKVGGLLDAERKPPEPEPEPEPEPVAVVPEPEPEPPPPPPPPPPPRPAPVADADWAPKRVPEPEWVPPPPVRAPEPPPRVVEPVERVERLEPEEPVEPVEPEEPEEPEEPVQPAEPETPPARAAVAAPVVAAPPVPAAPPPAPSAAAGARSPLVLALLAVAVFQTLALLWLWNRAPAAARVGQGELVVQTRPVAARVSVDGTERGVTPITIPLPAGAHVLEVQVGKSEPRVIPLTIQSGVQTAQYIELQSVPTTGGLDLRSDPPGARITIDGQSRGTTPATIRDLPPGDHTVVLEANGRKVTQAVKIEAGITAQLVVPIPRR
jgi:hypothetical protein